MPYIHTLNNISAEGLHLLKADYHLIDNAEDANAIIVRSADMHEMDFSDKLLCISRAGAGVNNIPLDKCAEQGIVVFNTPGANANAVKELVLAGLLMAARDISGGIDWCIANKDDENISKDMEKAKKNFAGNEIKGKKLGVIGLGAIGIEVANAASRLGMEVYGYDPYMSVKNAWMLSRNVHHSFSAEEIFRECEYITLHIPATKDTKGMINAKAFSMMHKGVVILNYARDSLVNDDDMAIAIESGVVRKYMTDFPNPKVMQMSHVVATPHLGASTEEAEDNCAKMAVEELMDYIENGNIRNSVNFPNCDMGKCTSKARLAVLHQNVPNMIGQITTVLANDHININNMTNASRGSYAYSMFDLESDVKENVINSLKKIQGVMRIRLI